jgi:adenylylsulfate kinase-like enzyme
MVIWLTGLSGAGKTTLGKVVCELIKPVAPVVFLDGDVVRAAIADGLGYSEADRFIQIGRMARLAQLLAEQGLVVVVAALYASDELLAWNRVNLPGYVEVYVSASLEALMARDSKGLYERARRGEARDVVGMDIPWHVPAAPDLVLDMDQPESPLVLARRIIGLLPIAGLVAAPALAPAVAPARVDPAR